MKPIDLLEQRRLDLLLSIIRGERGTRGEANALLRIIRRNLTNPCSDKSNTITDKVAASLVIYVNSSMPNLVTEVQEAINSPKLYR